MKVLWIVNMVFPDAAKDLGRQTSASGGWLLDLAASISQFDNIELATMTYYSGMEYRDIKVGSIRHFIFPGGGRRLLFDNPKTVLDCKRVVEEFQPDLIHIHGTEYAHALAILEAAPQIPKILTIQGIIKRISEEYYGGLSMGELLRATRLLDILKMKTPFGYKMLYTKNAKRELKVLKNVKYVTGRTDWDKATMLSINPNLIYYRCNYNLRKAFYESPKWDIKRIERHTILTGAGGYSLKGLHILLRALNIVKQKYPDVKLYVPGGKADHGKLVVVNGYGSYIKKLLSDLDIEDNVIFTGTLSAEKVAERLLQANVCVVPSAIEGASATLCEAMMVGTPAICSYRGGMTDLLTDGINGFTYDFTEYAMLAYRIMQIFDDDSLAMKFSRNAMRCAENRHNREKNPKDMIKIYKEIIGNEYANKAV